MLRLIDRLFCYALAFVSVLASAKRQRLGDMAARTLVVRTWQRPNRDPAPSRSGPGPVEEYGLP